MAENAIDLSNAAGARGLGGLGGADLIGAVAAESNEELAAGLEEDFRQMTAAQGRILVRLGEFDRRQGFRDEGATSVEAWTTERFGVSAPTARALAHVGEVAWNLPHLVGALCAGSALLRQGARAGRCGDARVRRAAVRAGQCLHGA